MKKFVIETVQVIKRRYYAEVEEAAWAHDGITMEELDEFSQEFYTEDIINTTEVDDFPKAKESENVNGAAMIFDEDSGEWKQDVRWDLV